MKLSPEEIKKFQQTILTWYKKNKRDLPWRDLPVETDRLSGASFRDPYHILVSEVMLQQTQVSRVIPKYEAWMQAFPTIESLAKASTRDVLAHWSGLGYNRRALYLKKCAEALVEKTQNTQQARISDSQKLRFAGWLTDSPSYPSIPNIVWPQTEKELRKLPGIGEYTARALLCFAFNHQVAVVDTNVKKVILVHFKNVIPDLIRNPGIDSPVKGTSVARFRENDKGSGNIQENKVIQQIAEELLPEGKAYDWNQALMDYAAAKLKAHKIPIPKQSKFADSDRYFRGQTIKLLLTKDNQSFTSLFNQMQKVKKVEKNRYTNIINQLEKDKLIIKKGSTFTLPE